MAEEKPAGEVTHYYGKIGVAVVKLSVDLKIGDELHFVGGNVDFTQTVDSMQYDHAAVEAAKKGEEIGLKVNEHVHEGMKVFKA